MSPKFIITKQTTKRETDSFKLYLKEIAQIKKFETPQKELECAIRAANGDEEAVQELINRNLRFVISVAKHYLNSNNRLEDLVNEGNIGLVYAARKFDPNKGFKFITYAVWWIRKNIREYITQNNAFIRLPLNKVGDLQKINRKIELLEQKLGRDIDINELLNCYDEISSYITKDELHFFEESTKLKIHSLDNTFNEDDTTTLHDILSDDLAPATDFLLYKNVFNNKIKSLLSVLNDDERIVLNKVYGMNKEYEKNYTEIGKELGVSREWVRQLSNNALKKLKDKIKETEMVF